jgi:hypothetical protein
MAQARECLGDPKSVHFVRPALFIVESLGMRRPQALGRKRLPRCSNASNPVIKKGLTVRQDVRALAIFLLKRD